MGSLIVNLAFICWGIGLLVLCFSNASWTMGKIGYQRTGWRKYRMGYTIAEITEAIRRIDDEKIKARLSKKITIRKIGWLLLAITPLLYVLGFGTC